MVIFLNKTGGPLLSESNLLIKTIALDFENLQVEAS